ncbi:MAG: ketoacyl-ACP synthase III [Ignavibacteria bacterium]|nr:ketoacyl-ACP synthase III [Ignavibacteria bacterium]
MAFCTINDVKISAMAVAVPKTKENNEDLPFGDEVNTKLINTTGIHTRHVASPGLCASDLCFAATEKLLADNQIDKDSIDLLIFQSQTPDYIIPFTSAILQNKLGLSTSTICFDMNMGCSGFVYALFVASSILQKGKAKRALVLSGDVLTHKISKTDRTTRPIFGDAGSATLLEFCENRESLWALNTDGGGYESIIIQAGGARNPVTPESFIDNAHPNGSCVKETDLFLSGMDIFNFSISLVPRVIGAFIENFGINKEEVDFFLFHQANLMINRIIAKKLGIKEGQMPLSLKDFGNTSSVSIPLTAITQVKEEIESGKSKVLMSGFGTGLSCASCHTDISGIKLSDLILV